MKKMTNGQSKGAEELIFGLVEPTGSDLNDLARKYEIFFLKNHGKGYRKQKLFLARIAAQGNN